MADHGASSLDDRIPVYRAERLQLGNKLEPLWKRVSDWASKDGGLPRSDDPSIVNVFATGANAQSQFTEPFPGQAGQRNNLRGPGFFGLDMGLSKVWTMPWSEGQSLQFRWEVFNVLNAVRFDPLSIQPTVDLSGSSFGQYTRLATNPRVMQFALRYQF